MKSKIESGETKRHKNNFISDSIVIKSPGKIENITFQYNRLRKDEVLVKVYGCSLQDDDIAYWEGKESLAYPLPIGMPGREGIGKVVEAGNLSNLKKGELVAILSNKCLSEFVLCNHMEVVRLPEKFKDKPFPIEAFAYAFYVYNKAQISQGQVVVLLGKGFLSRVINAIAKKEGATVIRVANSQSRNAHLEYSWDKIAEVKTEVEKLTSGEGADKVIEFTGTQPSIAFANEILRKKGSLVLTKKPSTGITLTKEKECALELVYTSDLSIDERISNIKSLIDSGLNSFDDPQEFLTHNVDFKNVEEAFDLICRNPEGYLKCMINFDQHRDFDGQEG